MYKLRPLDDSENGFYCPLRMRYTHWTAPFFAPLCVLIALASALQCRSEPPEKTEHRANLRVEILAIDASAAPRDGRPFVAGEKAHLTLRVQGGEPPYDLQLATTLGSPTLANASTRVEATSNEAIEVGMDLRLASEVSTGSYGLLVRVTDQQGIGASVRSEPFELVGSDAPLALPLLSPIESPMQLQIVDVAGRARASFYQGEEIHIRAHAEIGESVAVAIVASDERPFMPVREYRVEERPLDLRLRIPRLARVGNYQVQLASRDSQGSVPLRVVGTSFGATQSLTLEELKLLGGQEFRVPRQAALRRGEALRIEARVGGVRERAQARLRLRTREGQVVAKVELGDLVPSDPHPTARSMLSALWTPSEALARGRHVLEIELIEGDDLATLYREVVIR